jgi:uncharacterized membrane protein YhaH (DUF805 family)
MYWYLKVLRHYADFSGRARRKEFWYFSLVSFIVNLVVVGIDVVIVEPLGMTFENDVGPLTFLYQLAVLVPSLAVSVRRIQDLDRTGWWLALILVPFIGWLVLLAFFVTKGTTSPNHYGPDPKDDGTTAPAAAT